MSLYLVDSDIFIQAHRATYPIDVMPSFWNKIKDLALSGRIKSIDKVKQEIYQNSSHEDELKDWCLNNLPSDFFIETAPVIENYIQIVRWAEGKRSFYKSFALTEFLGADIADPWLVATAMNKDIIVVTQEKSQPDRKSRIKIPEVCDAFEVNFLNTIEMLRSLGEQV